MGLADFATVKSKDHQNFPGPGMYTPRLPEGRAATMAGRTSDMRAALLTGTSTSVGPGSYKVASTIGAVKGGRWAPIASPEGAATSGASTPRKTAAAPTSQSLGPKYDLSSLDMARNPTSPRFTFGSKHTPRDRSSDSGNAAVPAPPPPRSASESPDNTPRHKRAGFSFGIRPTHDGPTAVTSRGPGPGQYDVPRFGDSIGNKPARPPPQPHVDRDSITPRDSGPGPGAYDPTLRTIADEVRPKHQLHVSHGTMGARVFPPEPQSLGLGPGAYDDPTTIAAKLASKPGVSILARHDECHDMDDIYPRPAPGDYKIPSAFEPKPGKGFSFGSRHAVPKLGLEVPGPGHVDVPQYSMAAEVARSKKGIFFNANGSTFADGVKKSTSKAGSVDATPKSSPRGGGGGAGQSPTKGAASQSGAGATAAGGTSLPHVDRPRHQPGFTMSGRHKVPEPDSTGPGPGLYDVFKYDKASVKGSTFFRSSYAR